MATPLVAGCAAVLRETLVKNGLPNPGAALVKALLVNGAVELPGQYSPSEAGPSPNVNSGFGRVDLAGSVILPGPAPDAGFGEGGPLKQGDEDTIGVDIPGAPPDHGQKHGVKGAAPAAASVTFKVTLVWTDPPGAALQNDLDLIVRLPSGEERHGNMGTSPKFDRVNNVEQVVWTGIPAGPAEDRHPGVSHHHVPAAVCIRMAHRLTAGRCLAGSESNVVTAWVPIGPGGGSRNGMEAPCEFWASNDRETGG